ncbi:dethiobiotin synthase [Candidatus Methylobacter oryzae]|uniref:ATP-dependent dethiobiotin synthetase BioD n=1 Tax=Candidatus Methylobacter oryzae TaxID=2497749 RepID=A0ABY3CBP3_9GAMM|nr:dethiobiotin synthase [Candidatus Methylobacter oryzae]TRW96475.1 dethiobiotin synthase [Candidatus Methylobacter oryzae]
MEKGYFITGTDTNVGKTWATIALMRYFKSRGQSVAGMKPVASGCLIQDGRLRNEDALLIQENASVPIDYDLINPYAYEFPVSPHIAGVKNPVDLQWLATKFELLKNMADIIVVEGAGGWCTPLNDRESISDLARALALPVIIVVAIRLGCINHARLTYQAVKQSGLNCAGWIAVCTDPELLCRDENIQTIKSTVHAPLLGLLPYSQVADFNFLSTQMNI